MRQVLSDPKARLKPCLRCQRSLLKHLDDRFCPDCGLSVWMSLNASDALDRSRAQWLRGAAQGAWILAAAQPVAFAAYLIAIAGYQLPAVREMASTAGDEDGDVSDEVATSRPITSIDSARGAHGAMGRHADGMLQPSVAVALAMTLIGAHFLIASLGLTRLTVNERRAPDRQASARTWARIAAGIGAIVGVGVLGLGVSHLRHGWTANSGLSWLLLILIEVTFAGVAFCGWLYLRPIARRGRRSGLARLCGYLLFLPLIAFAKAAPFVGLWFLYLLLPLMSLLPLVYLPLSAGMLVMFARMLGRAAPDAEAAWAAESRPAS